MNIKRILVVDDDHDISELLKLRLTKLDYEVRLHHTARGVIEAAREFSPHLILLDVMLGDGLGYQVARHVRQNHYLYHIPLLFQSVLEERRDIEHAYAEGGDGYMTKPYKLQKLTDSLDSMQRIVDECERLCPTTGMKSLTWLRREVDHLLFRGEQFALFYIFMDGLTGYHRNRAHAAVAKIAFSTGRAIQRTIRNAGFYEVAACHSGGGYFMVKTAIDDRQRFQSCLLESFHPEHQHLEGAGVDAYAPAERGAPVRLPRQLLIQRTHTQRAPYLHASQMFDDLRKLDSVSRKHDESAGQSGGHTHWVG